MADKDGVIRIFHEGNLFYAMSLFVESHLNNVELD